MKQVTVTITTDKPVNVKITPCGSALGEMLDALEGGDEEDENNVAKVKTD